MAVPSPRILAARSAALAAVCASLNRSVPAVSDAALGSTTATAEAIMRSGSNTVTRIWKSLTAKRPAQSARDAAFAVVRACEAHTISRNTFRWCLLDYGASEADIDRGFGLLVRAGITDQGNTHPLLEGVEGLSREQALDVVRHSGLDIDSSRLNAQRLEFGWAVTSSGEGYGQACFYVGDDGVVEQSSSSIPPADRADQFAANYRRRARG